MARPKVSFNLAFSGKMRSPLRLGVAVSTVFLLVVVWTIWGNSAYLRNRWQGLDNLTDDLTGKLMNVVESENAEGTLTEGSAGSEISDDDAGEHGTTDQFVWFGMPAATVDHLGPEATSLLDPDEGKNDVAVEDRPDLEDLEKEAEEKIKEAQENLPDKIVVMGKMSDDDTTWVAEDLPDWQHAIYIVDAPANTTSPHTPLNKGREAMAYLTYIIDHYGSFPSTVAFIHSHRDKFWHSDGMPGRGNWLALRVLNTDYIQDAGYASLRCALGPGCPAEVQPFREAGPPNVAYERNMTDVWEAFWPGTECPKIIAAPCCAQFAVSGRQIMQRPKEEYVRYRDWLIGTTIEDGNSGRIFEYLWHVIFGQEPVFCPDYQQCWHDVYGGKSYRELSRVADAWEREKEKASKAKARHGHLKG